MSINVITNNFGTKFLEILDSTEQSVSIVSPFISFETANYLATWLEELDHSICCNIITRFNREEFIRGANSIRGLARLHQAGAKLFALQHLHSKLYLFDDTYLLMGSSNFTISGFFKNHELGIFVNDEPDFIQHCQSYVEEIMSKVSDWEISSTLLQKEIDIVERIIENRKDKKDLTEYNNFRWGAVLDSNENETAIQQVLGKDQNIKGDCLKNVVKEISENTELGNTGYRIKFEGTSQERIPSDLIYLDRKRSLHEHLNRTYYPRPPRSVQPGETVFISVVSERDNRGMPIIIGYAKVTDGFREENIISKDDYNFKKWNMDYPYYIEFTDAKFIKEPIRYGVSLLELCETLRHEVYPGTYDKPKTPLSSIRKRHHQKAHIQITSKAAAFLLQRLDQHFAKYGYDEVK